MDNKPNITTVRCLDNKRHQWEELSQTDKHSHVRSTRWCKKCGSITEFVTLGPKGRFHRFYRYWSVDSMDYYIETPKFIELVKEHTYDG